MRYKKETPHGFARNFLSKPEIYVAGTKKLSIPSDMAEDHYNEYIDKKFIGMSIVLTLIFWAAFTYLLVPFVPAETATFAYLGAAFTSACMSGVFYVAVHMFGIVLAEQRKAKA